MIRIDVNNIRRRAKTAKPTRKRSKQYNSLLDFKTLDKVLEYPNVPYTTKAHEEVKTKYKAYKLLKKWDKMK